MYPSKNVSFQFDGVFQIPRVRRDASALAVHSESGNLWTITDDRVRLIEFTNRGQFIREVELIGFDDAEGLCHLEGNCFLVAEEKKMRITQVEVPSESTNAEGSDRCIQLDVKSKKNKGLEGISYDGKTDTLFAVREGKPPAVYRIRPILTGGRSKTTKWPLELDGFKDLSDTFFDPSTRWLWLLSHESQIAVAFDSEGARVTVVDLTKGHHGLDEDIKQAEGIARDHQGTLFICSEPNLIYRFRLTSG
jgi:uncharacterized protein YjiK